METTTKQDELLELLEPLELTPELADQAAESFKAEHHDESDVALTKAGKRVIDFERGIGPTGTLAQFCHATAGVSLANVVGWVSNIMKVLKDDPKNLDKLLRKISDSFLEEAPEEIKEKLKEAFLGSPEATLATWALYMEGFRQGLTIGWRAHEIALLATTEAGGEESNG